MSCSPDGALVHASADEHPDLFWALRGGGGDYGVVTQFVFRAHRVGATVLAGMLVYPYAACPSMSVCTAMRW